MRFLVDENETPAIIPPLEAVFRDHHFESARAVGLGGIDDHALFYAAAEHGFTGLITRDRNQLKNPHEAAALIDAGLHWIGHKEPKGVGLAMIAHLVAGYVAAFPHVIAAIEAADRPLALHVRNPGREARQCLAVSPL